MTKNIGFVGLGIMGKPMAINIKKSGYNLSVFDRHQENINFMEKDKGSISTHESVLENILKNVSINLEKLI